MFTVLPRLIIALLTIEAPAVAACCYDAYDKYQLLAGCRTQIDATRRMDTQLTEIEAQLDEREAALDAAEAQLDGAKPR